jgi:hypothetical protein
MERLRTIYRLFLKKIKNKKGKKEEKKSCLNTIVLPKFIGIFRKGTDKLSGFKHMFCFKTHLDK